MLVKAYSREAKRAVQAAWLRAGVDARCVKGGVEVDLPEELGAIASNIYRYGAPTLASRVVSREVLREEIEKVGGL